MIVRYIGPRGVNITDSIRLASNDPRGMIKEIPIRVRAGGQAAYSVTPSPTVEFVVGNSRSGQPVRVLSPCNVKIVTGGPTKSGTFRIQNTGDCVLYLCEGALDDPDDVFEVLFSPGTLLPNGRHNYSIVFYPKRALHDYYATFRIRSNVGEILVPIHGRVQVMPQPLPQGGMADGANDELCLPLDKLCLGQELFDSRPSGSSILVQMTAVDP